MPVTLTPAPGGIEVYGNKVTRTWNARLTTYTALGEPLTPRQLGFVSLDFVDVDQQVYNGVLLIYDAVVSKLRAFTWTAPATNAAEEIAGGTDLSWITGVRLRARGF